MPTRVTVSGVVAVAACALQLIPVAAMLTGVAPAGRALPGLVAGARARAVPPVEPARRAPAMMAVPLSPPSPVLPRGCQSRTKPAPPGVCVLGLPGAGRGKVTPAADDCAKDAPGCAAPTDAGAKASGPPT